MRLLLALFIFISGQFCYSQNGQLFILKDKDTLNVSSTNLHIFIEVNGKLFPFNKEEKLIYPDKIVYDSINSLVVVYNNDTLSFFNIKELIKNTNLPLSIIKTQQPIYSSVFEDKRNMYFTIDNYPFENKDREDIAKGNVKNPSKKNLKELTVFELYYQVIQMTTYLPKNTNYR